MEKMVFFIEKWRKNVEKILVSGKAQAFREQGIKRTLPRILDSYRMLVFIQRKKNEMKCEMRNFSAA